MILSSLIYPKDMNFDLEDNIFLDIQHIHSLKQIGIQSNKELVKMPHSDLKSFLGIKDQDLIRIKAISNILSSHEIPVNCEIKSKEIVWMVPPLSQTTSVLIFYNGENIGYSQNLDVEIIESIISEIQPIILGNRFHYRNHPLFWENFLYNTTLLGNKLNHDYLYSIISGKLSRNYNEFVKYDHLISNNIIMNHEKLNLKKIENIFYEIKAIIGKFVYSKQAFS